MIHTNVNDVNRQCRRYKDGFSMNVFGITSVVTMQRRRCCSLIAQGWRAKAKSTLGCLP